MLKLTVGKKLIITLTAVLIFAVSVYYFLFRYKVIYKVPTEKKVIAITFDDGPDPRFTPVALEILKKYNAKATFFVIGNKINRNKEIVKTMLNEGHELGGHTYTHPDLLLLNKKQITKEIEDDKRIIKIISGKNVKWFRPPKKLYGPITRLVLHQEKMQIVLWQIALENSKAKTPQAMADRVTDKVKPGWIILVHDGLLDRTESMKALDILMNTLSKKGYKFVTVSQLLKT